MNRPVILVTGASRGLGAAVARKAARLGADVALAARSEEELAAVAEDVRSLGSRALAIAADLSRLEDCRRTVTETVEHFGRLDGLVNNAGVLGPVAPVAEGDPEGWQYNLQVNLLGPVWLTQAVLPHLRASRGRVVHVSSGAAVNPVEGWGAYSVSKAGLNHFSRVLAEEEPDVVSVAFRPGVVDTAMQAQVRTEGREGMQPENHRRFLERHRRGELLPPEVLSLIHI